MSKECPAGQRSVRSTVASPAPQWGQRRYATTSASTATQSGNVSGCSTARRHSRPNLASRVLKPAAAAVGLCTDVAGKDEPAPWVSFHTFRHTCASLLFAKGKNVKQVQEWLGHADPGFTLRTYVHLLDEGLGGADFFDEAVTAVPSRVNARSTEGPQTAARAGTTESADMAL